MNLQEVAASLCRAPEVARRKKIGETYVRVGVSSNERDWKVQVCREEEEDEEEDKEMEGRRRKVEIES